MTEIYSNFPTTSNKQSPQNAICIANSLLNFANRHIVCVNECTEANIISLLSFLYFLFIKVCFGFLRFCIHFFFSFRLLCVDVRRIWCDATMADKQRTVKSFRFPSLNLIWIPFIVHSLCARNFLSWPVKVLIWFSSCSKFTITSHCKLFIYFYFRFFHKLQHSFNLFVFVSLLIRYWIINNLRS